MPSVLAFGQWGYPIQGLGSYGGAEETPQPYAFTSEHEGVVGPGSLLPRLVCPRRPGQELSGVGSGGWEGGDIWGGGGG